MELQPGLTIRQPPLTCHATLPLQLTFVGESRLRDGPKTKPFPTNCKGKITRAAVSFQFQTISGVIVFHITAMAFSIVILRSTTVTVKVFGVTFSESPR